MKTGALKIKFEFKLASYFLGLGLFWIIISNILYFKFPQIEVYLHNISDLVFVCGLTISVFLIARSVKNKSQLFAGLGNTLPDIIQNTNELVVVVDRNLKIVSFNNSFEEYAKKYLKTQVYAGADYIKFAIPSDIELFHERLKNVFEGKSFKFERLVRFPNNTNLWIEIIYKPIFDFTGSIDRFVISINDITDKVNTQNELIYNKQKLQLIFDNSEAAIFVVDPEILVILDCNSRAIELLEADSKEQIIGKKGTDFLSKPLSNDELMLIRAEFSKNPNFKLEIEYKTLKGKPFLGQYSSSKINLQNEIFTISYVLDITQKKQIENKLKESENMLTSILDTTLETSALIDENCSIVFVDKQLRENSNNIFKHNLETGDNILNYLDDKVKDNFLINFNKALEGENVRFETSLFNNFNERVWIDVTFSPVKNDGKSIKHVLISYIDITHLKEVEEKLRTSETKFRELADSSPAMLWIADEVGKIKFYNKAWLNFRGISLEEEVKGGWKDGIHPDDYNFLIYNVYNPAIEKKSGYAVEYRLKSFDGNYRWILENAISKFSSEGKFEGFFGSAVDITDRKIAENKLKESELKFRELADTSPTMMWTADVNGLITFYNKAWLDFRGRSYEQEIGLGWVEGVHPDDKAWLVDGIYLSSFKSQTYYSAEYRLMNWKGEYAWILETGVPKFDKNGIFEGLVGSAIDITDRKKSEIKMLENDKFISRVTGLSPDITYIYDINLKQNIYSNRKFTEILGFENTDYQIFTENIFLDLVHPDDKNRVLYDEKWRSKITNEDFLETEFRMREKSGSWKWIQTRETIFATDEVGNPSQILGNARDITDKKHAEEVILNEQKFISRITELSPYIIYIYDLPTQQYVYMNQGLIKNIGLKKEQIIGHSQEVFKLYIPQEDYAKFEYSEQYISSIFTKGVVDIEFRLETPKFGMRWIQCRDTIFTADGFGNPIQILGSARDITNKKNIEEKLIQEQRFRSKITESSPTIIYIFDVEEQKVVYVNDTIKLLLGYEENDMNMMSDTLFQSIVYQEDIPIVLANIQKFSTLNDGEELTSEVRVIHRDGTLRWVLMKNKIFKKNKDGVPIQMLGNAADITERKAIEQKLEKEQKLKDRITKLSPDVIYIQNIITGENIYQNRSITDLLGYKEFEIVGSVGEILEGLVHPNDKKQIWDTFYSFKNLPDNEIKVNQFRLKAKDGTYHWIYTQDLIFSRDEEGNAVEILGNARDITEQKLAVEELMVTNKELQIANEELDGFVYRASHDLRSPLTSVLGLINILKFETQSASHQNYLSLMQKSIEKLMNVIEDLINHSKNTRMEVVSEPIHFEELISEMIQDLKYLDEAHKISFEVIVEGKHEFYSDKLRLVLLFNNLISNAIKYHVTIQENPFIKINIKKTAQKCIIQIIDNGSGIEEKYHDKIFNMFYRANRNSTGSGLGLYIVKGIVEKLSGTISLQSKHGEGTEFKIELPSLSIDI